MNFFKTSKEDEIIYSNLDLIYSIFKTQNELLSAMNNDNFQAHAQASDKFFHPSLITLSE